MIYLTPKIQFQLHRDDAWGILNIEINSANSQQTNSNKAKEKSQCPQSWASLGKQPVSLRKKIIH